jgi:hypothetical protein
MMSDEQIDTAAKLWKIGGDTMDMAEVLGLTEARIYSHLRFIRERARDLMEVPSGPGIA